MEQDRGKGGQQLGWVSDYTKGLVTLAGRIGLDTTDNHETALQKRLVVVLCAGTLPLTALWSAIYLAAGYRSPLRSRHFIRSLPRLIRRYLRGLAISASIASPSFSQF